MMKDKLEGELKATEADKKEVAGGQDNPDQGLETVELLANVQALTEERDELKDSMLRKQAEFENFRKRIDRERGEFIKFASSEVMRDLLTVLDSFELALNEMQVDEEDNVNVHKGFELIYKQLVDSLKRSGLEIIPAMGEKFDPHVHEAVKTDLTSGAEEGTVMSELRKGYLLNGKLLRPSMVTVAAAPTTVTEEGGS